METNTKQPDYSGITKGEWYVSDIIQNDGFYIYSYNNQFKAIARVYKSDDRPNAENDANIIVDAVNNQCKLINENEKLKAQCLIYAKDYNNLVGEVERLSKELSEIKNGFYMNICRAYNGGKENAFTMFSGTGFKSSHDYFLSEFPEFKTNVP